MNEVTWKPPHPGLTRAKLPSSAFAFPSERKEPLTDAAHVRSALARFDQVDGVSPLERRRAMENIHAAATYYGVHLDR